MSDRYIKLTREELYEKVWCKPTMQVAEEFGMSDVAVANICKKFNIPKPSRCYWQTPDSPRLEQRSSNLLMEAK